jgi:serine/threonine protein kinase
VGLVGDGGTSEPLVGQLIKGKYRLTYPLATGSLGKVYLAQRRGTGTTLVVKVFRSELAKDKELAERLRRQMMAVAALSETQPNIVGVYDCDQVEDGSLFIAMEQLEGRTLREVLRQTGAMELQQALNLAAQMADVLSTAHDAGIVHTDIHPQNVMVLGNDETIKIFGFERARLNGVGAMDSLVPSSQITRTPEYAAPEQIQRGEITKQTDIYAFGIVLYEMLTGGVPFSAPTPDAVLTMHLRTAPTPLRALRPEIPAVVEAKVLQALEKDPEARQSYANDVVNESLREFVTTPLRRRDAPIHGRQTSLQAGRSVILRIPPKPQRVGTRWTVAAIVGLLILVAAAAVWLLYPRQAPEMPHQPFAQPRSEEAPGGPTPVGESKGGAKENPPPSSETEATPQPGSSEGVRKEKENLGEKKLISPPKQAGTKSSRRILPLAPAGEAAPGAEEDSSDPSRIIDWVLKQRGTEKR